MEAEAIVLRELAAAVDRLPLRACHHGSGRAPPPLQATMSGYPRLLIAVAGTCRMLLPRGVATVEIALAAGDAVLVDAQAWNRPLPGDMAFLVLYLDGDHLRLVHWRQQRHGQAPVRATLATVPPALRLTVQAAQALGPDPAHEPVRRCLCEAALREAHRHAGSGGRLPPGQRLWQAVCGWMDQRLGEPIDRRAAATAFGVHPGHLSRVFRAAGEGFTGSLIRRRLERAVHLLRSDDLSIAEVGRRCGYPDPAAFANACRRHLGRSPRALRAG